MDDELSKALDNIQQGFDNIAEQRRKREEEYRAQQQAQKDEMQTRQEEERAFEAAVIKNKIEEVKEMLAKHPEMQKRIAVIYGIPSLEMAQVLIEDIKKTDPKDYKLGYIIANGISSHPEDALKWDKLAQEYGVSYKFSTTNVDVLKKVVEAGFSPQCFDFESVANQYYKAKNGYSAEYLVRGTYYGAEYDSKWFNAKPEEAAKLKADLISALAIGYQCDLHKRDSKSYMFVQELIEEKFREQQKTNEAGVYRSPEEHFYDHESGECRLYLEDMQYIIPKGKDEFSALAHRNDLYSTRLSHKVVEGVVKDGRFTGRVGNMYYRDGKQVSAEAYKVMGRIEERRQKRQKDLEEKEMPKIFKDIKKVGIELDSKILNAFAKKIPTRRGK